MKANFRKARTRAKINGTAERPRLSVNISNKHIVAQIIDDEKGQTLVFVTTVTSKEKGTMTELATWVGGEIAKKAKAKKITKVAFDRGARLYAGRMHALAEAARKGGLEF